MVYHTGRENVSADELFLHSQESAPQYGPHDKTQVAAVEANMSELLQGKDSSL